MAVGLELGFAPTPEHEATLRDDARRLTDDPSSIALERTVRIGRPTLVVRFRMPFNAQYKVVDHIARHFRRGFGSMYGYKDMWISFPKDTDPPSKSRRAGTPRGLDAAISGGRRSPRRS